MSKLEKKNFNTPDEAKSMPNAKMVLPQIIGKTIMKATFQPGWKWSKDIGLAAGAELC